MPCNDLRHIGMKENERNLFAAQLCSAFCFCCYSNRDVEVKLSDAYLHGRTGRVFFLYWRERQSLKT